MKKFDLNDIDGLAKSGTPNSPDLPTQVDTTWLNGLQSTLVNAIEGLGESLETATNLDLLKALYVPGNRIAEFKAVGAAQFTVPSGVYSVLIEAWAGGGGGSSGRDAGAGGSGGAAGTYGLMIIAVNPGNVINMVIGAGGAGGVDDGTPDGNDGLLTSIDISAIPFSLNLNPGKAGLDVGPDTNNPQAPVSNVFLLPGKSGKYQLAFYDLSTGVNDGRRLGGDGGDASRGGRGGRNRLVFGGRSGLQPGGGGAGGGRDATTTYSGGPGGAGMVTIRY